MTNSNARRGRGRKVNARLGYRSPPRGPGFQQWYAAYRATPRWAGLRDAIFERARGFCEGCHAPGEEVHHLSYEHVGHEFMFELQLLCRDCHERWHEVGRYAAPVAKAARRPWESPREAEEPVSAEAMIEGAKATIAALEALPSWEDECDRARAADVEARVRAGLLPPLPKKAAG